MKKFLQLLKDDYRFRAKYMRNGFLLGLAFFLVTFICRFFLNGAPSGQAIFQEINDLQILYAFWIFFIPLILAGIGYYVGSLVDEAVLKNKSISNLNQIFENQNITLRQTCDELKNQTIVDPITGLYNRHYLILQLEKELARVKRNRYTNSVFYIMMVDIDNFKKINDIYGHPIGDLALREVAEVLKTSVRKYDVIARYGGDEFVVFMPETSREHAHTVAKRIRENIQNHEIPIENRPLTLTLSIGLASSELHDDSELVGMIEKADQFLLAAKKEGKNRIISD